jgi:hypothetical protein
MSFQDFWHQFSKSDIAISMKNTYENSPWHRESSVWEHTQMCLKWYDDNLFSSRTETQRMITRMAIGFHDIGKPMAQVVKESPEKGVYRAYAGHEQLSARMWVDFAMQNPDAMRAIGFDMGDIGNVSMMLEYHVPWSLKDKTKRANLKKAFMLRMESSGHQAWIDLLLADQHGRIADEQAKHLAEVDAWLVEWQQV